MNLNELFSAVVAPRGLRGTWSIWQFLDAWATFVDEVLAGYTGDLYEYENELGLRDDLQRALTDERVLAHPDWPTAAEQIARSDTRLEAYLARGPEVRPDSEWWRRRLPPFAGDELIQDASRLFGVEIEPS